MRRECCWLVTEFGPGRIIQDISEEVIYIKAATRFGINLSSRYPVLFCCDRLLLFNAYLRKRDYRPVGMSRGTSLRPPPGGTVLSQVVKAQDASVLQTSGRDVGGSDWRKRAWFHVPALLLRAGMRPSG